MSETLFRVRAWGRRLGVAFVGVAVLLGVVAGLAMGLAAGTRRTSSAPERYARAFGGPFDVRFQQPGGAPITDEVRAMPGVRSVSSMTFVTAVPLVDGQMVFDPNFFAGDPEMIGFFPRRGRLPTSPAEFVINEVLAQRGIFELGQSYPIIAFSQDQVTANAFGAEPPAVDVGQAKLVGIVDSAGDFDDPSPTVFYAPGFLAASPDVGVIASLIGVRTDEGVDPATIVDRVHALPDGADVFVDTDRIVSDDARRAVRVQATALWIVVAISTVGCLLVIALVARRIVGPPAGERETLRALGSGDAAMRREVAVEAGLLGVIAAPTAVVVSMAIAARFPLGALSVFERRPGWQWDGTVALVGVVLLLVVVALGSLFGPRPRRRRGAESPGLAVALAARAGGSMSMTVGAGLAAGGSTGGRRRLSPAIAALGVAGVVGSVLVGTSLLHAKDDPTRWGTNYDALFGNPFVPAPTDVVPEFTADPEVAAVAGASVETLPFDGRDLGVFAIDHVRGTIEPTVLAGRFPTADDEIALGAEAARKLHASIGGTVAATADDGSSVTLTVVGRTVTPNAGGAGAAMTFSGLQTLRPTATRNVVLVDFVPGGEQRAVERLSRLSFGPPDQFNTPTSVRAIERVIPAPFTLAVLLAVLVALGTVYRLVMTVRFRRRDLTILRALGAERRQVRAAMWWQISILAVVALVVGIPLGVITSRWVVSAILDRIGIVPGAVAPVFWLVLGGVTAFVLANVVAVPSAIRAANLPTNALTDDHPLD